MSVEPDDQWRGALRYQPTIALLRVMARAGDAPREAVTACVALIAERDGRPAPVTTPVPAEPPAIVPHDSPGLQEEVSTPPQTTAEPAKEVTFDVRISDSQRLVGISAKQLVHGLANGWLLPTDRLETPKGSAPLSIAFAASERLQPLLRSPASIPQLWGAVAAKLAFIGMMCWVITGPMVRDRVLEEDAAPLDAMAYAVWLLLWLFIPDVWVHPVVGIGGLLLLRVFAVSLLDLLGGMVTDPITIVAVAAATAAAYWPARWLGAFFDKRFHLAVRRERGELPEDVRPHLTSGTQTP